LSESRWKTQERRIAKLLGLSRNPQHGQKGPDIQGGWLVVEVKDRREGPEWIYQMLQKAREHAGKGRLGLGVITSPSWTQDLVILTLRDFVEWFGVDKRKED